MENDFSRLTSVALVQELMAQLISSADAAKQLEITEVTLRAWHRKNPSELAAVRIAGRWVFWMPNVLEYKSLRDRIR